MSQVPHARLVSYTNWNPDYLELANIPEGLVSPEGPVAYAARVSSPNPKSEEYERLLLHCLSHGYWSVFEQADATMELTTSRAVSAQLLRHKSFYFQEFNPKHVEVIPDYQYSEARIQASGSETGLTSEDLTVKTWWEYVTRVTWERAYANYLEALALGISKEQAKMLLPLSTTTKLLMKGSLKDWLHYLNIYLDLSVQLEHRLIAYAILTELEPVYPTIFTAAKQVYPHLNVLG